VLKVETGFKNVLFVMVLKIIKIDLKWFLESIIETEGISIFKVV
jgi:hypothetical protein